MFEARHYQELFNSDRFIHFRVVWKETELLIGVTPGHERGVLESFCKKEVRILRDKLDSYIYRQPSFLHSHEPVEHLENAPEEVIQMCAAAQLAGTGPMAAVAGMFAETVGKNLLETFGCEELFVENGGDIFLKITAPLIFSIHAGKSPLSGRIGIELPPGTMGLCTSSGKVGHSFSYGKADAVTVAAVSTPLADALATAVANRIHEAGDIGPVLSIYAGRKDILSLVIICDDQTGIRGDFPVVPVKTN